MKKKIIRLSIVIAILVSTFSMSLTAFAGKGGRRAQILSRGALDFNNKTVYFTAEDLYYIADQIDDLESNYKISLIDSLNTIGIYYKLDGTIVYQADQNEVDTAEEKIGLSYGSLLEGIRKSQSLGGLTQTQATDKDGNPLYYKDAAARDSKDLLNTTTANTGYPVYYRGAVAANLTAGTAAWIEGKLVKGNGADNAAFYDKGVADGKNTTDPDSPNYKAGYNAGAADTQSVAKVGTVTADKVLAGYTFTNSREAGIMGTMPDRGDMNWSPDSGTTHTVEPGYYSGGILNSTSAYNSGYAKGVAEALNSSKIDYIYHTHSADCVEACDVYVRVTFNDGAWCHFHYEYENPNYSKYPHSETFHNNYAANGGPGLNGTYPLGYYAKESTIYFCTAGSSDESQNTDTLTGKQDTSIIEGATINMK